MLSLLLPFSIIYLVDLMTMFYLDRFPGSLHKVSPLLKFIVAQLELPRVRLHDV